MRIKDGKAKGKAPAAKSSQKAIVRRELKSVLTSGTIVDGSLLTDDLASHCVAIKASLLLPLLFIRSALSNWELMASPYCRRTPRPRLRFRRSVSASSTPRPPNFPSPPFPTTRAVPKSRRSFASSSRRKSSTRRATSPSRPSECFARV